MLSFFNPVPHKTLLPASEIARLYPRMRIRIFCGMFIGYAGFYLFRKNFALVMPYLVQQGFSKAALGDASGAIAIAYGFSKFLMGSLSDRSNPRVFLTAGLILSAIVALILGLVPQATSSMTHISVLLFLLGWFGGMGFPPCGRSLVHWFSLHERGRILSYWNPSHNLGGMLLPFLVSWGIATFGNDWRAGFYVPAVVAIFIAVISYLLLQDTPQSCGLPPIEEYTGDYPVSYTPDSENELTTKEIFLTYILKNKLLWLIALASGFIHVVRTGVLDWAPIYLKEVKGLAMAGSAFSHVAFEAGGIPGAILCGWMSDKLFKSNRGLTGLIFMLSVLVFTLIYWKTPAGYPMVDYACLGMVGFLIYGPAMVVGLHAMEKTPKKAAGTASGFTGLFGYMFGAITANSIMGRVIEGFGWEGYFALLIGSCISALLLFLLIVWKENLLVKRA